MNKDQNILIFRIFVCLTGWFSILIRILLDIESILNGSDAVFLLCNTFSYFTVQSNVFIAIWLTLIIIYRNKDEKPSCLSSIIQGALTLYITVTFLVFAIFLSAIYHPTGWEAVINITMHYIIPIAFIIDWLITGTDVQYKWKYILYWLIYPLSYLVYTLIRGFFINFYPYPFLNLNILSLSELIFYIIILVCLTILLSSLYIFVNNMIYNKKSSNK
ncbi:MAG: Pr6Pr family membrane protein [Candidatus Hermodarchaeota archaeon]